MSCWFVLFLLFGSGVTAQSLEEAIRGLGVDSVVTGVKVYYSAGSATIAAQTAADFDQLAAAISDSLGPEWVWEGVRIALLSEAHWKTLELTYTGPEPFYPDGMGFRFENDLIVLPVPAGWDTLYSTLAATIAGTASPAANVLRAELESLQMTLEEALIWWGSLGWAYLHGVRVVFDFAGHTQRAWLQTLTAAYIERHAVEVLTPERLDLYQAVNRAVAESAVSRPPNAGIADFDLRRPDLTTPEIAWYLGWFSSQADDVFDASGYRFLRDLKDLLASPPAPADFFKDVDALAGGLLQAVYHYPGNCPGPLESCIVGLGVGTETNGVTVYHSIGQEERAIEVVSEFDALATALHDSLGPEWTWDGVRIALLNHSDWEVLEDTYDGPDLPFPPDGAVFRLDSDLIVLPSPPEWNVLFADWMRMLEQASGPDKDALLAELDALDLTVEEALAWRTDLYWATMHGTRVTVDFAGYPRFHWLRWVTASMVAYHAVQVIAPERVELYKALALAASNWTLRPDGAGIFDYEDRRPELTHEEFIWYITWLEVQAHRVFDTNGYQFFRCLHDFLPGPVDRVAFYEGVNLCADDGLTDTKAEDDELAGRTYTLLQNYPNPFNPETRITYRLARPGHVELTVHDLLGRRVKTLVSGQETAGEHGVVVHAEDLPSGTYYYRLISGDYVETKPMVILR